MFICVALKTGKILNALGRLGQEKNILEAVCELSIKTPLDAH